MEIKQFGNWDSSVHSEEDSVKRINSASKAVCTPASIDREAETGNFSGSSGEYKTSLSSCTCIDFIRRKKPCKHIYRLAMELNYIDCSFVGDSAQRILPKNSPKSVRFKEAAVIVDSLPTSAQLLLRDILHDIKFDKIIRPSVLKNEDLDCLISSGIVSEDYDARSLLAGYTRNNLNDRIATLGIPFKKNMKLSDLVNWCMDNIEDEIPNICSDRTTVIISEGFRNSMHKIYNFLVRLHDYKSYIDVNGEYVTVRYLDTILPDDDVTEALISLGHVQAYTDKL
jgi:hypothetical protein